jgi:type IV secretion system protein VirB9
VKRALLWLGLVAVAAPLAAQVRPEPGPGDPRIQTVLYDPDQVVQLQAAPGYQVGIELATDEQIENVAVGDSAAWQVTPSRRGDHLFVKPLAAGVATNMTIVTSARVYLFELMPLFDRAQQAFTVRFRYPGDAAQPSVSDAPPVENLYRVSGDRALRPSRISDDGVHTFIEWPEDRALPAVYAVNAQGREMLVNGGMRDGIWVIDGVADRLVFRIDRKVAHARRLRPCGVR